MSNLTTKRVLLRIAVIITAVEASVMALLHALPFELTPKAEVMIDVALLALISTPIIYCMAVRPFELSHQKVRLQLEKLANTDALTGLGNRREMLESFKRTVSACTRHHRFGAILMIDLDEFKPLNDQYGHDMGDRLLKELAHRLREAVREEDSVGRLGGDEFMIIANDIGDSKESAASNSLKLGRLLLTEIARPVTIEDIQIAIAASIGVRLLTPGLCDPAAVYRDADNAMYQAKAAGKGQVVLLDSQDYS